MSGPSSSVRNRLLAKLSSTDFALLQPHLMPVTLDRAEVVIRPDEPIGHACFLESGVTSTVVSTAGRRRIEVGLASRDGMAGIPILLGADRTPHETFMQVGSSGWRIEAKPLLAAMRESPSLNELLLRYAQAFHIQTAHTAMANGIHTVGERLARWLLMCHDRLDGDELPLTHDFIAVMLGVRRPGVTEALHILEAQGSVRAGRGSIIVLDRTKLEETAGDSYGLPEAEYRRLIGPLR